MILDTNALSAAADDDPALVPVLAHDIRIRSRNHDLRAVQERS